MIIQGTNEPIVLLFAGDLSGITDFSAVLVNKAKGDIIKQWSFYRDMIGDVIEQDGQLITPIVLKLEQTETMDFPFGTAVLQVKWANAEKIWFADEQMIHIKKWEDKTRLRNV